MKSSGISEAFLEGFGGPVGMGENPVDLVGEGAVEYAGVVGSDNEVDIGFEECVDGAMRWIWPTADAKVGCRAGFDDGAERGEAV